MKNKDARQKAYKIEYEKIKYKKSLTIIEHALISPQTIQSTKHDLKNLDQVSHIVTNGGVYDVDGDIVEPALHNSMGRFVPDTEAYSLPATYLKGNWLFGGFAFRQVGHMLTESSGRLWVYPDVKSILNGIIFIQLSGNFQGLRSELTDWLRGSVRITEREGLLREMLDIFGIDIPFHLVGDPVSVERLFIPSQLMGLLPFRDLMSGHPDYRSQVRLQMAKLNEHSEISAGQKIYVSRSKFSKAGSSSFIAERQFEGLLQRQGYSIVHPEKMRLADQIKLYARASHIILAAGSAVHVAALAMNGSQSVCVIKRYYRQNDQFTSQLRGMGAQNVLWLNAISGVILPVNRQVSSQELTNRSSAVYIIDWEVIWRELRSAGFVADQAVEFDTRLIEAEIGAAWQKLTERTNLAFAVFPLEELERRRS